MDWTGDWDLGLEVGDCRVGWGLGIGLMTGSWGLDRGLGIRLGVGVGD